MRLELQKRAQVSTLFSILSPLLALALTLVAGDCSRVDVSWDVNVVALARYGGLFEGFVEGGRSQEGAVVRSARSECVKVVLQEV